jgi:hypothetical protein
MPADSIFSLPKVADAVSFTFTMSSFKQPVKIVFPAVFIEEVSGFDERLYYLIYSNSAAIAENEKKFWRARAAGSSF